MTVEKQFINKSYYETFLIENETRQPIEVLGALYRTEESSETADLSYIRFAQGEIYYHSKDLEAAIFKWEKVENELQPWAIKNIADSYFEIGILDRAEELYTSIVTDCSTLTTEIALQLFSLHIEQNKTESAFKVIQEAVSLNPDYPNVTSLARAFYEEQEDWNSAIELAAKESIRTESLQWFVILEGYVSKGYTKEKAPGYFYELLAVLHRLDHGQFVQMVSVLWQSYKNQDSYLAWIQIINLVFVEAEVNPYNAWDEISFLYEDAYQEFMAGQYFISELHDVLPNLLTNWLKLTPHLRAVFPAAALLAWSEKFPYSIEASFVSTAKDLIYRSEYSHDFLENALRLFDSITQWAERNDLEAGPRWDWLAHQLADAKTRHLVVTGVKGNGTSSFINSLLGETVSGYAAGAAVAISDGPETEIAIMDETTVRTVSSLAELELSSPQGEYVHVRVPSQFLYDHALTIFDIPNFQGAELFEYARASNGLLVVLNVNEPFTEQERRVLLQVRKQLPNLPIHFLLNKMDTIYSEQEAMRITEGTQLRIQADFPNAAVLPYSSLYASRQQVSDMTGFLAAVFALNGAEEGRAAKILYLIKDMIMYLIRKREEKERRLAGSIEWNEDVLAKLNAAIHKVSDLEQEKAQHIAKSYAVVKEAIQDELTEQIPKLLQECSDILREDSDFRNIHVQLNEEMNKRIQSYLQNKILPECLVSMQEWIASSREELLQGQDYLEEMSEAFNALYEEEKIRLQCDFRVIDDWQRDAERITSTVQVGETNVFLRTKPSQLLLKSAGKLFGALGQNRTVLYNQYKKHVESEDYSETAAAVTNKFLLQFELLEKGLVRDVGMFFRNPLSILSRIAEETDADIQSKQQLLDTMKARPEMYHDPLTLFQVKLRQYEWVTGTAEARNPLTLS
ncbi:GTP-binding protein [Ectobacillus funiculus]|uniref:GTP-binding protein n=1 Tax=Ectobacillus funiculus TaxID=137993 RepID=UPI00101DFA9B|nr:GTP-binding protein [Ectobacillus funiculus]